MNEVQEKAVLVDDSSTPLVQCLRRWWWEVQVFPSGENSTHSSRSLAFFWRCRRRNRIKIRSIVRAKLTSKCHESKSNSIWSDRFFSPILLVERLFFEPLSTISIDWNRNLLVVLPNKVFYGNCVVVCRISLGSSSQKAEESCHCNYANGITAFLLAPLFIYKIVKFSRERVWSQKSSDRGIG